ncbi:ImmA/IrrE family metallo-endopeptidase [Actibacterium sp. 188UL27-1]|uniref:ImmA/IrrE family metallo-endopeptidase n=1 Tax=Actibacterium sp. 188UL27-1 TaxID=2786961 RepID=UPI00195D82E6|nr:ImmA/IrrE family metallo-endopeptidase [Actibacterium sp. 188UL27-1]MBM7069885.1 ImmA/IrrE family metallo-endopeptidase [Actibacterium sp. 188UL27-1]
MTFNSSSEASPQLIIKAIDQALNAKTGGENSKSSMRRLCTSLLKESGQTKPPYRVKPLLDMLDVEFAYESLPVGKEEAAIQLKGGKVQLAIPKARFKGESGRSRRWRFSIAHEFAHIILIRAVGARVVDLANSSSEAYDFVEDLCDFGASQLLIPRSELTKAIRNRPFSQKTVRELTDLFDVSMSSMFWSIADLVPEGGLILLKKYKRNARDSNELRVSSVFSRYTGGLNDTWLPVGCTMKHIRVGNRPLGFEHIEEDGILPIELILGKRVRRMDSKVVEWSHGTKRPSFLNDSRAFGDSQDGRGLLIACAPPGKFDDRLFGANS